MKIPKSKPQPVHQYAFHYPTKHQLFFVHHLLSQQACSAVTKNPSHPNSLRFAKKTAFAELVKANNFLAITSPTPSINVSAI